MGNNHQNFFVRTRLSRLVAALARKSLRMVGLRRRRLSGDRRGGRKKRWGQNADERIAPETQLVVARPGGRDRRACPGCAARIGRSGRWEFFDPRIVREPRCYALAARLVPPPRPP